MRLNLFRKVNLYQIQTHLQILILIDSLIPILKYFDLQILKLKLIDLLIQMLID